MRVVSDCDSEWVTRYYGSFLRGWKLWIGEFSRLMEFGGADSVLVVMEYLAGGSCLDLVCPPSSDEEWN